MDDGTFYNFPQVRESEKYKIKKECGTDMDVTEHVQRLCENQASCLVRLKFTKRRREYARKRFHWTMTRQYEVILSRSIYKYVCDTY